MCGSSRARTLRSSARRLSWRLWVPAVHCACLRTPAAAQLGLSRPMFLRAAPGHSTAKLLLQRCRSLPQKKRLVCPVAPRTAACRAISRARCRCVCHCLFPPAPPFSALQPCARVTCVRIAGAAGWPWRAVATLGSVGPATKVCDSHRKLLVGIFIVVTAVQANAFLARLFTHNPCSLTPCGGSTASVLVDTDSSYRLLRCYLH